MNKNVVVGRYINGISINGLEYLLDNHDETMIFDDEEAAKTYLRGRGFTDEEFEAGEVLFIRRIGTCFRCGSPLFPSQIEGYTSQCFSCDEDFFSFEQEEVETAKDAIADKLQIARSVLFAESEDCISDEKG